MNSVGTAYQDIVGTMTNGKVMSQITSDRAVWRENESGMGVATMRSHVPPLRPMPLTASSMFQ